MFKLQIGSQFVIDSTLEEEICMSAKLLVGVNSKGQICGIIQTGSGGIAPSTLSSLLKLSKKLGKDVLQKIDRYLVEPKEE